jgi:addiction module RelE/StbE family toxin
MLTVKFAQSFLKSYGNRIKQNKKLKLKFEKRLEIFRSDRNNPLLKDHGLVGKEQGQRSFSITGDIRVIYFVETENIVWFIDIGSHNQVY